MKDIVKVRTIGSNVEPLGDSSITLGAIQLRENRDSNIVRAIALKDVDSFIIDTLAVGNKEEEVFLKEGFVKTSTFCKDDGTGIIREYAEYVHRRRLW